MKRTWTGLVDEPGAVESEWSGGDEVQAMPDIQ